MRYITQFGIIMGVTMLGDLLRKLLPLPIPAAVWGMFVMLFLLCTGLLKLSQVEQTANFFLEAMPLMFVVVTVSIIEQYPVLQNNVLKVLAVTILTTIICFGCTGLVAEKLLSLKKNKEET